MARIKELPYSRIDEVLEVVGLAERKDSAFKTYSLGMKQRLAIAAALLPHPEVLILDEPTNGLDPQGISDIRALIQRIAQDGTTILLASHLLDEVEKVCDHVAVLQRGNLLYADRVDGMGGGPPLVEVGADNSELLGQVLREHPSVLEAEFTGQIYRVSLSGPPDPASLNAALLAQGVLVNHLLLKKTSLEDLFLSITNEAPAP